MRMSDYDRENRLWVFMTEEEEKEYFFDVCDRVISNPRYYLDNLDDLFVFLCRKRNIYK
jgi:hypothetical protein